MHKTLASILGIFSFLLLISCNSLFQDDGFYPDSEIDLFKGGSNQMLEAYSDSLFLEPFTINDLSRDGKILNINVTYAGGEGGCPSHLFVIQWDEQVHTQSQNYPLIELGIAHFIPTEINCEALVKEVIKIDLEELLKDQLADTMSFKVLNLVDSTTVELKP